MKLVPQNFFFVVAKFWLLFSEKKVGKKIVLSAIF
jgi:hypothetical protein